MCGKKYLGKSPFAQILPMGVFFFYKAIGAVMNISVALVLGLQHIRTTIFFETKLQVCLPL